jgi:hypothetical protein
MQDAEAIEPHLLCYRHRDRHCNRHCDRACREGSREISDPSSDLIFRNATNATWWEKDLAGLAAANKISVESAARPREAIALTTKATS